MKKRKFRLVANETQSAESHQPTNTLNLPDLVPSISHESSVEPSSLPNDRRDLLKLVNVFSFSLLFVYLYCSHIFLPQLKASLSPPRYALFIKTLTSYQRDESLDALVDNFFLVFDQPEFFYLFRGMRRFVKEHQKADFDKRVADLKWFRKSAFTYPCCSACIWFQVIKRNDRGSWFVIVLNLNRSLFHFVVLHCINKFIG